MASEYQANVVWYSIRTIQQSELKSELTDEVKELLALVFNTLASSIKDVAKIRYVKDILQRYTEHGCDTRLLAVALLAGFTALDYASRDLAAEKCRSSGGRRVDHNS